MPLYRERFLSDSCSFVREVRQSTTHRKTGYSRNKSHNNNSNNSNNNNPINWNWQKERKLIGLHHWRTETNYYLNFLSDSPETNQSVELCKLPERSRYMLHKRECVLFMCECIAGTYVIYVCMLISSQLCMCRWLWINVCTYISLSVYGGKCMYYLRLCLNSSWWGLWWALSL